MLAKLLNIKPFAVRQSGKNLVSGAVCDEKPFFGRAQGLCGADLVFVFDDTRVFRGVIRRIIRVVR